MKERLRIAALFMLLATVITPVFSASKSDYYVDKRGTLRERNTHTEASFFGVNYTMPFAHAYRTAEYVGFDRREAIDKDVYHMSRLGFNAYRIHIWDVEISDGAGNLIENDHLDLLDYLIYKLQQRGIKVFVTTMTNFGNGYPERNINTGAFSYLYDKCSIHSDSSAIIAQQNYIKQLLLHINPYTGSAYNSDSNIVAFEINNEPCHATTPSQTKEYIDTMLAAVKSTGNRKPVFYNVSHNMGHVEAYYNTAVDGTTYQWYPIGLVSGHLRKGNFLPYVDSYDISFSGVKHFNSKAKAVYEFDPADILYSYMFPAIVRTFRSTGFQWITQFAYDPIDMAAWNTEYQTHYLNLAYTPQKALSMKIAAEVAYNTPIHAKFAKFPADTVFGDFRVSYAEDLSEMNNRTKFYYTNNTSTTPKDSRTLESVAGFGRSAVVDYRGTGAYFIDKISDGVWRLEVMPDAITVADPFAKSSLKREVTTIVWNNWPITITLPDLGTSFGVRGANRGNTTTTKALDSRFSVSPGVYILEREGSANTTINGDTPFNTITIGEFVAPQQTLTKNYVLHTPATVIERGSSTDVLATIASTNPIDSAVVYNDKISFWSTTNIGIRMTHAGGYTYTATLPLSWSNGSSLAYNIVLYCAGKATTYPQATSGMPLEWDFVNYTYYTSAIVDKADPIEIISSRMDDPSVEALAMGDGAWCSKELRHSTNGDGSKTVFTLHPKSDSTKMYVRKFIKELVVGRSQRTQDATRLCLKLGNIDGFTDLRAGFITCDGFTYTSPIVTDADGTTRISLSELTQGNTALLPMPYPTFLRTEFTPDQNIKFASKNIETFEFSAKATTSTSASDKQKPTIEIISVWIE